MIRLSLCAAMCAATIGLLASAPLASAQTRTDGRAQPAPPAQPTFDIEQTVQICAACHGEDGKPVNPDAPVLWGQQFYYLYVQMKDYKAGRRANETMQPIVADFDKDQMKALAQYFADKPWPRIEMRIDPDLARQGQKDLVAGQCTQCHNQFHGDSRIPRVAGQRPEYIERTLLEFKNRVRLNAPAMGSIFESYEDQQIHAMAQYLAGL